MPSWQCRLSLPCEFYIYGWKFSVSINCWLHVVISHSKCAAALSIQQCETGEFHGSGKQVHVARFCAFSSIAVVTCSKCNMHAVFMDSSCHPFHILKVYEKHLCPTWSCSSHCANKPESDIRSENLSHMQERSTVTQCCQFELKKKTFVGRLKCLWPATVISDAIFLILCIPGRRCISKTSITHPRL